jgi:hypothetical protein
MSTPTQGQDTDAQTATLEHAANIFEGLLFPEPVEGKEPEKTADDKTSATDDKTEPETKPETDASTESEATKAAEPSTETQPKVFKWVINGQEVELTEEEAKLGYLRQSDYTKKTQEAAQIRKEADAERESLRTQRADYLARLEQAKQAVDALIPQEPDWAALKAQGVSDKDITAAVAQYQAFAKDRDRITAEQTRVAKETQDDAEKQYREMLAGEQEKLLNILPEWRDPAKGKAESEKLVTWLRSQGFDDPHIAAITNHKMVASLYAGMQWEGLQSNKTAKPPKPAVRTVAPGGQQPPKVAKGDRERAADRLQKSGKVSDAARAFELIPGL